MTVIGTKNKISSKAVLMEYDILCFQSPPQARTRWAKPILVPHSPQSISKAATKSQSWYPAQPQSISKAATKSQSWHPTTPAAKHFKKTSAKHLKKPPQKRGTKKLSAPQYLHFAAQQTCITSNQYRKSKMPQYRSLYPLEYR